MKKLNIDSDGWLKRPLRGFLSVEECCEDGSWDGCACAEDIFCDGDSVEICEVINLTDEEKRRVEEIRNLVEKCPEDVADEVQNETFLLDLLERAGVIE